MNRWSVSIEQEANGRWQWRAYHGPDVKGAKTNYATYFTAAAGAGTWLRQNRVSEIGEHFAAGQHPDPEERPDSRA